jgi:hypothetical protein
VTGPGAEAPWLVTEDMVAEAFPCGPDPERYSTAIREYLDAGYDGVYLQQMGKDLQGFLRFYRQELQPRFRSLPCWTWSAWLPQPSANKLDPRSRRAVSSGPSVGYRGCRDRTLRSPDGSCLPAATRAARRRA